LFPVLTCAVLPILYANDKRDQALLLKLLKPFALTRAFEASNKLEKLRPFFSEEMEGDVIELQVIGSFAIRFIRG